MGEVSNAKLLTLPNAGEQALSIRAKALVFSDPRSQAILEHLQRVAPTEATVLVIGETGTGKELVARHVHECSGRSGPFVAINCGAFSENLIEAELFGHEAGAFTGAQQARPGWFEAASGGTLFLDEVGDMPMALQVKLLRVLQEKQVVRLGSRRPIKVDVRLIAATNVELERAVEAGHFRRDLYYRLNVAPVSLPPLRERRGDIMPLAEYFVGVFRRKLGLGAIRLCREAQERLLAYEWPGNIRELENVIHFALIMAHGDEVRACDLRLPGALGVGSPAGSAENLLRVAVERRLATGEADLFAAIEREVVETAYNCCHGNQVHTARALGISRNILRAQLKRFGLLDRAEQEEVQQQPT
jgi:sigma-54 dependent transcriptional regulator